ncbi:beta-glucosidase family protein [Maricaulis parjimensis]|uniref:beta-glucosidase family protein n=1 Tax=Maricaulis parjimensis TaxID=144023 RepID=UPI00193AB5BE|nr:beta-glucosidase [Maricaulis parjimensis]
MMTIRIGVSALVLATCLGAASAQDNQPWRDTSLDPAERARLAEAAMTDDERFNIIHGPMALQFGDRPNPLPDDAVPGAGYIPGVERLGIPSLRETDASLGITNPFGSRPGDTATAFPGGLAMGSTFNLALMHDIGGALGLEARSRGFNVLLGGGMNLVRDPRNGRNFEYLSEDPLLTGLMAAASVRGSQEAGVVTTVKHFSLNGQETNRHTFNAIIDPAEHRESDLLAFQIALEEGQPASIMCAYNLVNGHYACGNDELLNNVLRRDWNYQGWVLSDWGAVYDWRFAEYGLDQQSGQQLDDEVWFDAPLRAAVERGDIPHSRISEMVQRILYGIYSVGIDQEQPAPEVDLEAHGQLALEAARQGLVLLKNEGDLLPLTAQAQSIAVIGGRSNYGVLSGGGSSQVTPDGGFAAEVPIGGDGSMAGWRAERYFPGAPLDAIRARAGEAQVRFDPGQYPSSAASIASQADIAIVFVTSHAAEGFDQPDLTLPNGQDAIVAAAAAANPNTIVVLETGNPVAMPWIDEVGAVMAAWYPGQAGAQAITEVLFGDVNPSGHLPVTFPIEGQYLRIPLPGLGTVEGETVTVEYEEGSDVGYRWFARTGTPVRFPFGHGLSYTSFAYSDLQVTGGETLQVTFEVENTGDRAGADVPQVYLTDAAGHPLQRLVGFDRVVLEPGDSAEVSLTVDARLLAEFDSEANAWQIAGGEYGVAVAASAGEEPALTGTADVPAQTLEP